MKTDAKLIKMVSWAAFTSSQNSVQLMKTD